MFVFIYKLMNVKFVLFLVNPNGKFRFAIDLEPTCYRIVKAITAACVYVRPNRPLIGLTTRPDLSNP